MSAGDALGVAGPVPSAAGGARRPGWFARAWTGLERGIARFARYPLLTGQVALYVLIAWGVFGGELGASDYFWHEFWLSQAAIGAATCWLFGTVVFVSILLLAPHNMPGLPTEKRPGFRSGWWPTLFPSRNPGVRKVGVQLAWWLLALLVVLYAGKWCAMYIGSAVEATEQRPSDKLWDEALAVFGGQGFGLWFVAGYLLSAVAGAGISYAAFYTGAREWIAAREPLRRSFANPTVAVPTIPLPAARGDGELTTVPASEVPLLGPDAVFAPTDPTPLHIQVAAYNLRTLLLLHAIAAIYAGVLLVFIVPSLVWVYLGNQFFSPGVLLTLFLVLVNVVAGIIVFRVRTPRLCAMLLLVVLLLLNMPKLEEVLPFVERYRMTYDNITYDNSNNVPGDGHANRYDSPLPLDDQQYQKVYREQEPEGGLIGGEELLAAFEKKRGEKPRLVVIAVSGGGIRAAVWTGVVLEGLEGEFDGKKEYGKQKEKLDIRDHIRVIAGASGGMVGASAYAANFVPDGRSGGRLPREPEHPPNAENGLRPFSQSLARDSLTPVAQTMLVHDFTVNTFWPRRARTDRGRRLEDAWVANFTVGRRFGENADQVYYTPATNPFGRPFRALREAEAACERPSLVVAPMFVEDSKRLLVSNLDLDFMNRPRVPRLRPADPTRGDSLSLPAVEFFRLFPESDKFTVASAARMNASFPVVSPAVALPVKPVRRVVDGGYFDNYGVDVLANWLLHNRDAIVKHTSGVLLIQIRAYPLEEGGHRFEDHAPSPAMAVVGAVSAPLDAVLTARGTAAYHRNNEMLAEVDRAFNAPGIFTVLRRIFGNDPKWRDYSPPRPGFFSTVVFEQQQEAALSWYLTTPQKKQVAEGFYNWDDNAKAWTGANEGTQKKLDAISKWLTEPPAEAKK